MKRLVFSALFVFGIGLWVLTASALPPIPKYIEEEYAASSAHAKYLAMYKSLEGEHKCDACHKPGVDKKTKGHALNDYGQAVAKNFKHRDFNKADKLGKDNPEGAAKAKKLLAEALEKADAEKNADGKTFGELIRAGQLPGKN
ncbi:MAG TPA: hypothetical protein VGI40_18315 [Pirellulaceae bacterium]